MQHQNQTIPLNLTFGTMLGTECLLQGFHSYESSQIIGQLHGSRVLRDKTEMEKKFVQNTKERLFKTSLFAYLLLLTCFQVQEYSRIIES